MSAASVSVVIPAHNSGHYIIEAIKSVLSQDYPVDEIIVVDDGSTDGTAREAEAFQKVRCVRQKKMGASAARNRGVREASGAFIAFQDADDLWLPGKLRRQMEYMMTHPDTLYTAGKSENFYDLKAGGEKWMAEKEFDINAILLNTVIARKALFESQGFWFDETLIVGEDTEWFLRLQKERIQSYLFPDILTRRRLHDQNLTKAHHGGRKKLLMDMLRSSIKSRRPQNGEENGR